MRRVAAGEANQTDGLLYKGLPLRVLSDNDLILKDDIGIPEPQRPPRTPDMSYLEEDGEGEDDVLLTPAQLDAMWDELSEAMEMLNEDPRYRHIGEKLEDLMRDFTAAMSQHWPRGGM